MQARDIMTTNVVTAAPDTSARDVARLMLEHRISGVPVVDSGGQIVGIITDGDLYRRAGSGIVGTARLADATRRHSKPHCARLAAGSRIRRQDRLG